MKQFGRSLGLGLGALVLFAAVFTVLVTAQAPQQPAQPMSFFVTSAPKGDGANYGGLAGADAYCQQLAAAAGRGAAKWVAYLSTQGPGAVNARDRIGNGPWYNARGAMIAANQDELHGDTIERARLGNRLNKNNARDRKGRARERRRRHAEPARHPDRLDPRRARLHRRGRPHLQQLDEQRATWKRRPAARRRRRRLRRPGPSAQLGHPTRPGGANGSWNSTHGSRGCSQPNLVSTGGAGCCTASLRTSKASLAQARAGLRQRVRPFFWLWFRSGSGSLVASRNCEFGPAPCAGEQAVPETDTAGPAQRDSVPVATC